MKSIESNEKLILPSPESAGKWIWAISVFSLLYSLVRYVVFTPKLAQQIPCFIVNKAVGMAASFLLILGLWHRCRRQPDLAGIYFQAAFFAVVVHIPLSLTVLRPGYFPDFYPKDGSMLVFWGEMVVLFGALSLALLWKNSRERSLSRTQQKMGLALLATLFAHVGSMGICRGLNIDAKHAYLPPMWLISLFGLGAGLFVMLRYFLRSKNES